MAVATYVFVSMFTTGLTISQRSRTVKVATDLADTQLQHIVRNPGLYTWPAADALSDGKLAQVRLTQGDGANGFAAPAILPPDAAAQRRESAFYERFSWDAYARVPNAGASYAEVTVVVRWTDRGSGRVLALTSCVPSAVIGSPS